MRSRYPVLAAGLVAAGTAWLLARPTDAPRVAPEPATQEPAGKPSLAAGLAPREPDGAPSPRAPALLAAPVPSARKIRIRGSLGVKDDKGAARRFVLAVESAPGERGYPRRV